MELQHDRIEPNASKEKRLVIAWPEKNRMKKDRDQFVSESRQEVFDFLKKEYEEKSDEVLASMTRYYLGVVFMINMMQEISPIGVEVPIDIGMVCNTERTNAIASVGAEKKEDKIISFHLPVNMDTIGRIIEDNLSSDRMLQDVLAYTAAGKSHSESERLAREDKKKRKTDLDIFFMTVPLEEFGHMLYEMEADKGSMRKTEGVEEHRRFAEVTRFDPLDVEGDVSWYLSLDIEQRGRMWRKAFLKKYYPDTKVLDDLLWEIKYGKENQNKDQGKLA